MLLIDRTPFLKVKVVGPVMVPVPSIFSGVTITVSSFCV